MLKYLLINVYNYDNQGEMAQVMSLVENLEGDFTIVPVCSDVDVAFCKRLGIKIAGRTKRIPRLMFMAWLLVFIMRAGMYKLVPLQLFLGEELRAFRDCDMVLDLSGDTFSDDRSPLQSLLHCAQLLPAILMSKPFVLVSQSIGRFTTPLTRALARYVLMKSSMIIARESISEQYLVDELRIPGSKVRLAVDVGFLLNERKIAEVHDYVGVNISQIISQWMTSEDEYVALMAGVINHLSQESKVVMVPHVTGMGYSMGKSKIHDDRIIAEKVYSELLSFKNVEKIRKVYDTDETKGIIASCRLFIGARFHACLAAISLGIPTLILAYSQKSIGLAEQVNLPWVAVVDVRGKGYDALSTEIWEKIDEICGVG